MEMGNNKPAAEDQLRPIRKDHSTRQFSKKTTKPTENPKSDPSKILSPRMLKLALINDVVFEWVLRVQSRAKSHFLKSSSVINAAARANEHIMLWEIWPNKQWFKKFLLKFNLTEKDLTSGHPYDRCTEPKDHLSLNMSDIIDFVRKSSKWNMNKTGNGSDRYQIAFSKGGGEVIQDVVPVHRAAYSIIDDNVPVKCKIIVDDFDQLPNPAKRHANLRTYSRSQRRSINRETIPSDDSHTQPETAEVNEAEETVEVFQILDDVDLVERVSTPLNVQEIVEDKDVKPMLVHVKEEVCPDDEESVPRKVSRLDNNDSSDTKAGIKPLIRSNEDVLRYLKALENFVLLEANFRAIGVISELEKIFQNPDVDD